MKAIMISIQPKWVARILNGEKTIEIRKTMPKCDLPIDVYIYCTKDNSDGYLYYSFGKTIFHDKYVLIKKYDKRCIIGNGKVVAKFTLNKVVRYVNGCKLDGEYSDYEHILKPSCLTEEELCDYCNDLSFYAWHINELSIFYRPKELTEFNKKNYEKEFDNLTWLEKGEVFKFWSVGTLTKAPQSWCYVEV